MDVREKLVELLCEAQHIVTNTNKAEYLVEHGVTVQEWISVNERFPCVDTTVLAYDAMKGDTHTATFDGTLWHLDGGWLLDADDFTHWMPLPQPPKGE